MPEIRATLVPIAAIFATDVNVAAPQLRLTTADHVEAIGMRVLRIAEDMASGSRNQGHSERLIEQAEQAAIDLRAAVRGR